MPELGCAVRPVDERLRARENATGDGNSAHAGVQSFDESLSSGGGRPSGPVLPGACANKLLLSFFRTIWKSPGGSPWPFSWSSPPGWRPRFTAPLHWWLTFSLATSAVMVDGGDQVSSVLTLLLLPVALTDGRKWHWQADGSRTGYGHEWKSLVALFALLAIRVQVAGIYFHAAVGKMRVEEWTDGTVLYYWFTDPQFGATGAVRQAIEPLLRHGPTLALMTWGAMLLELSLFMALVMPKKAWRYLLPLGIAFHASIAIIHGLVSFFFAMAAALVLYLRPVEQPFVLPNLVAWKQRIMRHRVAVAEATNLHPQPVPVGK